MSSDATVACLHKGVPDIENVRMVRVFLGDNKRKDRLEGVVVVNMPVGCGCFNFFVPVKRRF